MKSRKKKPVSVKTEITENMVKMYNLLNKSCCNPRLQSKSHLSKKLLRKTEKFLNQIVTKSKSLLKKYY